MTDGCCARNATLPCASVRECHPTGGDRLGTCAPHCRERGNEVGRGTVNGLARSTGRLPIARPEGRARLAWRLALG